MLVILVREDVRTEIMYNTRVVQKVVPVFKKILIIKKKFKKIYIHIYMYLLLLTYLSYFSTQSLFKHLSQLGTSFCILSSQISAAKQRKSRTLLGKTDIGASSDFQLFAKLKNSLGGSRFKSDDEVKEPLHIGCPNIWSPITFVICSFNFSVASKGRPFIMNIFSPFIEHSTPSPYTAVI